MRPRRLEEIRNGGYITDEEMEILRFDELAKNISDIEKKDFLDSLDLRFRLTQDRSPFPINEKEYCCAISLGAKNIDESVLELQGYYLTFMSQSCQNRYAQFENVRRRANSVG